MSSKSYKGKRIIVFIFVNKIQYPCTLNNSVYHSNIREPPPFFHSDANTWPCSGPFCWQNPALVVTVELIWLLFLNVYIYIHIHIFIFVPSNKNVRFSKWPRSLFCSCFSPMTVHLRNLFLLSTRVARMLLTPVWVSKQKNVRWLLINISNLTLEAPSAAEQRFLVISI